MWSRNHSSIIIWPVNNNREKQLRMMCVENKYNSE